MAEPRADLKLVDENFTASPDAPAADKAKAVKAAAIREGIRRQKQRDATERQALAASHAGQIEGVKLAHTDELNRTGKIVSRAAHRDGLLMGIIAGMGLAIALAFSTWVILREVVITNVSTQRVPIAHDGVPELVDHERPVMYERNPREPPDARQ